MTSAATYRPPSASAHLPLSPVFFFGGNRKSTIARLPALQPRSRFARPPASQSPTLRLLRLFAHSARRHHLPRSWPLPLGQLVSLLSISHTHKHNNSVRLRLPAPATDPTDPAVSSFLGLYLRLSPPLFFLVSLSLRSHTHEHNNNNSPSAFSSFLLSFLHKSSTVQKSNVRRLLVVRQRRTVKNGERRWRWFRWIYPDPKLSVKRHRLYSLEVLYTSNFQAAMSASIFRWHARMQNQTKC